MPSALVVGAAGGIGRETALLLSAGGFTTHAVDRKALDIPGVKTALLDITSREEVRRYARSFSEPLDALVVSAAVHSTHPVEHLPDELVDRVLDINLNSHIKLVRDFLPHMKDGGSIVGISSIAACVGVPMSSLYSASKAGLEGFYESLRTEMGHRGIRVSIIHPGNVNTGFNETGNTYPAPGETYTDRHYRAVVKGIDSSLGISPLKVARTTVKVLGKKNPRFCYVVGMNARKANWAKKLLGRDLAIKLMGKFFGF